MNVVLAVAVVGVGSLVLRVLPLVGATKIPDRLSLHAARAAMAVIAATTVRTVLRHRDDALAGAPVSAPVLAAVAVAVGLWLAYRGRSMLAATGIGLVTYVALAAVLVALSQDAP
jgi:branched-subunit amino acid transport protein AzlD